MPTRKNFDSRIKQRREEAAIRWVEYNMLDTNQKITRVKTRPGNSTKELAKLARK